MDPGGVGAELSGGADDSRAGCETEDEVEQNTLSRIGSAMKHEPEDHAPTVPEPSPRLENDGPRWDRGVIDLSHLKTACRDLLREATRRELAAFRSQAKVDAP